MDNNNKNIRNQEKSGAELIRREKQERQASGDINLKFDR